jgi:hypothetical protein
MPARQWRQSGLAHAIRRFGARHDVDVELWHVRNARDRIVTEVALLDDAVLERYCSACQTHRQAHHCRALYLRFHGQRLYGQIAVNPAVTRCSFGCLSVTEASTT